MYIKPSNNVYHRINPSLNFLRNKNGTQHEQQQQQQPALGPDESDPFRVATDEIHSLFLQKGTTTKATTMKDTLFFIYNI